MYRAKWDGRNRYAMFESGMQDVVQERMELEMDLREALAREQFFLAYQPTLDLADMTPDRRRGADPLAAPGARHRAARTTSSRCSRRPG